MKLEDYKMLIKQERKKYFKSSFELVYDAFVRLKLDIQKPSYFVENASKIIHDLRRETWKDYKYIENDFTKYMLKQAVGQNVSDIDIYIEKAQEHMYALLLSNTQSRRSRAGADFEAIIELLLMGADILFDSQGMIGKKLFESKNLSKNVDFVVPSVFQYHLNKRQTVLISAKTTLRERWQQVIEELERTGASEMMLATVDHKLTSEKIDTMRESNVYVVTTQMIKQEQLIPLSEKILSFEELLAELKDVQGKLQNNYYPHYDDETKVKIIELTTLQQKKRANFNFAEKYYRKQLQWLKSN